MPNTIYNISLTVTCLAGILVLFMPKNRSWNEISLFHKILIMAFFQYPIMMIILYFLVDE